MARFVKANEATASRRRVYFDLRGSDGIAPALGETGQPQVSSDGATWTNTGISAVTETGNGRYYADLTQTLVATAGTHVETRYKSAGTVECPGDSVDVVGFDPYDAVRLGLSGLANAAPGAANGLPINGANTGPVSWTGGWSITNSGGDALALTSSGSNGSGLNASGNGTADGIKATGGATGRGVHAVGGATSGAGIRCEAQGGNSLGIHGLGFGSGAGIRFEGGPTGQGAIFIGGSTSGDGIDITTTAGDGLSITPTAGNAIVATANGTSKHGMVVTGGTAGTSDGIKAVAGTGGLDVRGVVTANVTFVNGGAVTTPGKVAATLAASDVTGNLPANIIQVNSSAPAAAALAAMGLAVFTGVVSNDSAPTTTSFTANTSGSLGLSTVSGYYVGSVLTFTSGPDSVKAAKCTSYTVSGAVGTFGFAALPAAPAAGNTFAALGLAQ